ncbi:MAG: hypothetical protein HIU92_19435 [Proteobacteria bacterium]|nr:hypothetical protein [Pseudomonadota bacterium]
MTAAVNALRETVEAVFVGRQQVLDRAALSAGLAGERMDVTLPPASEVRPVWLSNVRACLRRSYKPDPDTPPNDRHTDLTG